MEIEDCYAAKIKKCGCATLNFHSGLSLSRRLELFDPKIENFQASTDEIALGMRNAIDYIRLVFERLVKNDFEEDWVSVGVVKEAYDARFEVDSLGRILLLPKFVPWRDALFEIEEEPTVLFAVHFDDRTLSWRCTACHVKGNRYENRALLKEQWRGLRDEELIAVSGIQDLQFVHPTGFTGGAKTKEAVIQMVKDSLG